MTILLTIVMGAIVGYLASIIMKSPQGMLMDIVLGIVGAIVGSFIMNLLGQPGAAGFNVYSFLVALLAAIVIIWVGRLLARGTAYS